MLTTLRLSSAGPTFAYRDSGAGEPVVLIHGVGLQSAAWGPQIAALSDGHRVIALDMPGHGGSDPLREGATIEDFVDWCHQALDAMQLGAVNLAGHSMGAMIASGVAVTYPEQVRRVALLNGGHQRSEAARLAVLSRAAEIHTGKIDIEAPLTRWFGDTPRERAASSLTKGWLRQIDPAGYATAYMAFAGGDTTYSRDLAQLACPLMALTGGDDPNSTPQMAKEMAAAVPSGEVVVIEGHRHMVNLTAPDAVNAHLHAWLDRPQAERKA